MRNSSFFIKPNNFDRTLIFITLLLCVQWPKKLTERTKLKKRANYEKSIIVKL